MNMSEHDSSETRIALLEQIAETTGRLVSDHENRLRWAERILYGGWGIVAAVAWIVKYWLNK